MNWTAYNTVSYIPIPISAGSMTPAFSCCACKTYNSHQQVIADPQYSTVYFCTRCGHTVCETHLVGSLCYGCSFEEE